MPTFDHPVGGTCAAVGHPGVGTGTEPRRVGGMGALSSVKGRDCGVGSSGRRGEYARLLGAFLAAVVASLGGVSVLSRTGKACCCACGDFGGG